MKLYAWAILGFRLESGSTVWNQYVYYTWVLGENRAALAGEITKKSELHFPEDDGWFDVSHTICEILTSVQWKGKRRMFTDNEMGMLMEALDALEKSRGQSRAMELMIRTMMSRSKEEALAMADDMKDNEVAEQLLEEQRREDILMLKAKLIQLRRSGQQSFTEATDTPTGEGEK